jgi:hypothetical protein
MMSEDIKELAKALCEAQGKIKNVHKESSGYQYKYADLGNCINAVKEPLRENGLALTQLIDKEEGELVLITLLMHTSGQWIKSAFPLNTTVISMQNKMQAFGAVISYARRYSLAAIIGLAQEDDDGNTSTHNQEANKREAQPNNSVANKLKILCQNQGIDVREFAKFHNLSTQDLQKIAQVVQYFNEYYTKYINHIEKEASDESTHS